MKMTGKTALLLGCLSTFYVYASPTDKQWENLEYACTTCARIAKHVYNNNPQIYGNLSDVVNSKEYLDRFHKEMSAQKKKREARDRLHKKIQNFYPVWNRAGSNAG